MSEPIWTDRPGESFPSTMAAARAVGVRPNAINRARDRPTRTSAGRYWYSTPPEWARREIEERQRKIDELWTEKERARAAAVQCNPGRHGYIVNGCDVRTGIVYVNGKPVASPLAELAKGAAA